MPDNLNVKNPIRYLQFILAILIVAAILYLAGFSEFIEIIGKINPFFVVLAALAYLMNNLLMTIRMKKILTEIDRKIRFKFAFFSHMSGMLLSDFTPARSGYVYVAYALKKHGISAKSGLATITSTYIYDLFFKIIIAVIAILYVYSSIFDTNTFHALIIAILMLSALIILYILIMFPSAGFLRFSKKIKILEKLIDLGAESKKIQKYSGFILSISLLGWIMKGLEWFFIAIALNITQLSLIDSLILNPLLTLFSFIPLTPAGWGIQEAGIVGLFGLIGITGTYAVSFSLMTRFVEIAVDLLGIQNLFSKDLEKDSLNQFYNTIDGDIDEKAYNSDLLVQKYWQQRKTDEIKNCLEIKNDDVIVDIGCGSGVQIRETGASSAKLAIGVDLSRNAISYAKTKKIPNTDYIIADAEKLPFKSEAVNKIICAEIIEHLMNPDDMILEVKRVLKKDGEIVITTPNEFSFWGIYELFWDLFGRGRNYGQTHLMFYSPGELRNFFHDFSEANTKTIFFASPFFALFNSVRLLTLFKKLDSAFERANLGLSLILHAKK